jgi:hypothetical protein
MRAVIGPTADGYYLIYMIGSAQPHVADCTHGVDPEWVGAGDWLMSGHIAMGYSRSPEGPWSGEQSRAEQSRPAQSKQDDSLRDLGHFFCSGKACSNPLRALALIYREISSEH